MLRPDLTRIISRPPQGGPGVASKCICPYFIAAVSLNMNESHHDDVDFAIMAVTVLQGKSRKAISVARRCLERRSFGNRSALETILNHKAEAYLGISDQLRTDILQQLARFVHKNQGAWPEAKDWEVRGFQSDSSARSLCTSLVGEAKEIAQELRGHFGPTKDEQQQQRDTQKAKEEAQKAQRLQKEKEFEIEREQVAREVRLEREERIKRQKFLEQVEARREAERYAQIRDTAERKGRPRREANLRELRKNGKPPRSYNNDEFVDKDQV